MAKPSAKRRQQARQRKAARRMERRAKRPALMYRPQSARALLRASGSWPLHECLLAKEWQKEYTIIQILVARRSPAGQIAAGVFLADPGCMGVKSAFASLFDHRRDYERELRQGVVDRQDMVEADVNHVAKIIRETIAYAKELGFKPDSDYRSAMHVLGDADPDACDVPIQLGGADGRPLYFAGPHDNVSRILAKLTRKLGPDGFTYIAPPGGEEAGSLDE